MKRILSLTLIFTLLLGMFTIIPVSAEEIIFTFKDFEYIVHEDKSAEIVNYKGTEADVTIPSRVQLYKVKYIGDSAFMNNTDIKSVKIPEGIISIGENVFYNCSALTNVSLPDSLESGGSNCFTGSLITEVKIPSSMTKIPDYFFDGLSSL